MDLSKLKNILEAALFAAAKPLSVDDLLQLFLEDERPERADVRAALAALGEDMRDRGIELTEVASGFRMQVRPSYATWVSRLWQERAAKYSRALLETLALIAYRQPITRGEIEDIRGVAVSTNIVKTLLEREWVRVIGHRDVPGKPAIYGSTKQFLDYFGLKSLDELPPLSELRDIDSLNAELALEMPESNAGDAAPAEYVVNDEPQSADADDAAPAAMLSEQSEPDADPQEDTLH